MAVDLRATALKWGVVALAAQAYLALKLIVVCGVGYRFLRSALAVVRSRIPPALLATRTRIYWGIVRA